MPWRGLAAALAALVLAAPAQAGGPAMRVGAAEDFVKQPDLVSAKAKMTLVRLAGFDTVRITAIWAPGQTQPEAKEAGELERIAAAAQLSGVRVVVSVYHFGSRTTPLTDEARAQFAAFAAHLARTYPGFREFIVGNEPNLNRFWLPQFNADGTNAAAPAYLQLLAQTYDALKAVSPSVVVWGGAVSPRGVDRPGTGRDTHSPTKFIRDLGRAYRASGRTLPVMDGFAFHPYGDSSRQAPRDSRHPGSTTIGLADYDKLVRLLGEAFDGTRQAGSSLPILYDEYGVETVVPAAKRALYTGTEPPTIRPVDERTQAAYYREAIGMSFCQPNVRGILLFHVADEPTLAQWQSGVMYADATPKASFAPVRAAARESRRGVIAQCSGMWLVPKARLARLGGSPLRYRLTCDLDCRYIASLVRLPGGEEVHRGAGTAQGAAATTISLAGARLSAGSYRLSVRVRAPVNPGPTVVVTAPVVRVQ